MITRRGFLKRMAMAAAACALIDVRWPEPQSESVFAVQDTAFTVSTYPRWKPARVASAEFNHAEVEHYFRVIAEGPHVSEPHRLIVSRRIAREMDAAYRAGLPWWRRPFARGLFA